MNKGLISALIPLVLLLPALPEGEKGERTARVVQPNIHPDEMISGGWIA